MTDEILSLVDDAVDDLDYTTPLDPDTATLDSFPEDPAERERFVKVDLRSFHEDKFLWAANYFVLWPLGLALTVTYAVEAMEAEKFCERSGHHDPHKVQMADQPPRDCMGTKRTAVDLHVREWSYPEDEQAETIEQDSDSDLEDYAVFTSRARERILAMKPEERKSAIARLESRNIASAIVLLVAA